jgi:hypothetical protein
MSKHLGQRFHASIWTVNFERYFTASYFPWVCAGMSRTATQWFFSSTSWRCWKFVFYLRDAASGTAPPPPIIGESTSDVTTAGQRWRWLPVSGAGRGTSSWWNEPPTLNAVPAPVKQFVVLWYPRTTGSVLQTAVWDRSVYGDWQLTLDKRDCLSSCRLCGFNLSIRSVRYAITAVYYDGWNSAWFNVWLLL